MQPITVLSLFDGISCGRVALERAGIPVHSYFASEIDKHAIAISKKNYQDIEHIGDVTQLRYAKTYRGNQVDILSFICEDSPDSRPYTPIDLLIGGSPCQDLSIAKTGGIGLQGSKSSLFCEYVRILNETKPRYFLLENVASMKKQDRDTITEALGVEPVLINSALVSAQNRKRLYWVGERHEDGTYKTLQVSQPADKGIMLKDILEDIPMDSPMWRPLDEKYIVNSPLETKGSILQYIGSLSNRDWANDGKKLSRNSPQGYRVYGGDGKSPTLTANGGGIAGASGLIGIELVSYSVYNRKISTEKATTLGSNSHCVTAKTGQMIINSNQYMWRKLTPVECERLQTLQDGYSEGVANTNRYKAIGNGWTVDVIAHILSHMKKLY